uniref:Uncharacterized protein n=1 Tax=Rhizophora mucronata TaxID=61149 RepID=A0A2P2L415_RHIMU
MDPIIAVFGARSLVLTVTVALFVPSSSLISLQDQWELGSGSSCTPVIYRWQQYDAVDSGIISCPHLE